MIRNRSEYRQFIAADAEAMEVNITSFSSRLKAYLTNPRWRFIRKLRRVEFYQNARNPLSKLAAKIFWLDYKRFGMKLGFSIPPNVCDKGLSLPHYGTLVISKKAKIGKNARIHICVNIGESSTGTPSIGDNVYIGPGAKLFGGIVLGNNIRIGANAVVNKSFEEDNIVLAGVPAKIVKRLNHPTTSVYDI